MVTQNADKKGEQIQLFCVDNMVPQDYPPRIIDKAINWSFIYELAKDKYSQDNGHPSMGPVVLIKTPFIQYLYGVKSMRQMVKEIEVNIVYRWFPELGMLDKVSHSSTFGKSYTRRFRDTDSPKQIFTRVLSECYKFKLVDPNEVFVDATHVKTRANNKKMQKRIAYGEALFFEGLLKQEIDEDREAHERRPSEEKGNNNNTPSGGAGSKEEETMKASTSDPEGGWFRKGEHKYVLAYAVQTTCDENGWILSYSAYPGNNHDNRTSEFLYDKIKGIGVETLTADAGYKTPGVAKLSIDQGVKPLLPYKRLLMKEGFFKEYEYVCDEYYDCYICPSNQMLTYRTANREGCREYKSYGGACASRTYLVKYTQSKDHAKAVTRHIWEPYVEMCEEICQTLGMRELYPQRKETIGRIFGGAKENRGFRYTQMFGKVRMEMKVGLTFVCMNLKKLARMKAKWGVTHFTNFILNVIWSTKENWFWGTKPKTSLSIV